DVSAARLSGDLPGERGRTRDAEDERGRCDASSVRPSPTGAAFHPAAVAAKSARPLIIQSLSFENFRHAFLHPGLPGLGLLGRREKKKVRAAPPWRQGVESRFQAGNFVQFALKLVGSWVVGGFLESDYQTRFFNLNRLTNIGFRSRFDLDDVPHASEPNLTRRLYVFRLPDENAIVVPQQGAFDKQNRAIVLESVNQDNVLALECVTGNPPLQLLGQPAGKNDRPQLLELFPPRFRIPDIGVNLGVRCTMPVRLRPTPTTYRF